MIDKNGNVTCDTCGKYLGNINGDGDYFALIRKKRCPECQAFFTKEKKHAWNQEKRRKDKALKKRLRTKLQNSVKSWKVSKRKTNSCTSGLIS